VISHCWACSGQHAGFKYSKADAKADETIGFLKGLNELNTTLIVKRGGIGRPFVLSLVNTTIMSAIIYS